MCWRQEQAWQDCHLRWKLCRTPIKTESEQFHLYLIFIVIILVIRAIYCHFNFKKWFFPIKNSVNKMNLIIHPINASFINFAKALDLSCKLQIPTSKNWFIRADIQNLNEVWQLLLVYQINLQTNENIRSLAPFWGLQNKWSWVQPLWLFEVLSALLLMYKLLKLYTPSLEVENHLSCCTKFLLGASLPWSLIRILVKCLFKMHKTFWKKTLSSTSVIECSCSSFPKLHLSRAASFCLEPGLNWTLSSLQWAC